MRKITQEAVKAFLNETEYKKDNTEVRVHEDFTGLYLHWNLIAKKYTHNECIKKESQGKIMITTSGWNTTTTKERLNGIPGVSIKQKKGVWYLNGKEFYGSWTTIA